MKKRNASMHFTRSRSKQPTNSRTCVSNNTTHTQKSTHSKSKSSSIRRHFRCDPIESWHFPNASSRNSPNPKWPHYSITHRYLSRFANSHIQVSPIYTRFYYFSRTHSGPYQRLLENFNANNNYTKFKPKHQVRQLHLQPLLPRFSHLELTNK